MRKKKLVKRVAGIALTVGAVILAIVCVGKVNRIQNEKDIIEQYVIIQSNKATETEVIEIA